MKRLSFVAAGLASVPGSVAAKPVRTFVWPVASIASDIRGFLEGTKIQIDQTGDPSHAVNLVAPVKTCGPASTSEVDACLVQCRQNDIGQPSLLKACVTGCHALTDCPSQCGAHSTANFVSYGFDLMLGLNQSCEPNRSSPDVNGTDITSIIPDPIYDGCHMTRLRVAFSDDITTTELVPGKGIHLNVRAEADDPTMHCGFVPGKPTWHHSNFDLYFNPSVMAHRVNWTASSSFNVDVSWWGDWFHDITGQVKSKVNSFMATALDNPSVVLDINEALTFQLTRDLKMATGDDVDDILSIIVTNATAITVTYLPICAEDVCSCTTSCNGLHFCDPQYWNSSAPATPCPGGQNCLSNGACCTPSCRPGGSCGSDGCGGSCGECPAGQACANAVCRPCSVDLNCLSHACRPNACGIYCGKCRPGWICDPDEGCQDSRPVGKPPRALLV